MAETSDMNPGGPEKGAIFVAQMCDRIKDRKRHWKDRAFEKMKRCRYFALHGADKKWVESGNLIANACGRVLNELTTSLYARNPRTIYQRRPRMDFRLWDEQMTSWQAAVEDVAMGRSDPKFAMENAERIAQAEELLQDIAEGLARRKTYDNFGKTLTILYDYFRDEQMGRGRRRMKSFIRRSFINGVSYVVPGFQRIMGPTPEQQRNLTDHKRRLDEIERRAREMEEGDLQPDDPEAIELREMIDRIANEPEMIVREGLTISFPDPTTLIPDRGLIDIHDFEGCNEVAEEFVMRRAEAEAIYGVDLEKAALYSAAGEEAQSEEDPYVTVWRLWQKSTGLCFTICDGHPELLLQDTTPPVQVEPFWPWIAATPRPSDNPEEPFPISIVEMIEGPCMEINKAAQGRSDHRYAARPGTIGTQAVSDKDAAKIGNRKAHDHVTLETQLDDIRKAIMDFPYPGIDQAMYDDGPSLQHIDLISGSSEARINPTPRVSATAASISEASFTAANDSNRDDLDEVNAMLARISGEILMQNMTKEQVEKIVGPGAVWFEEQTMAEMREEIFLTVEFGSSGYPNQQQRVATLRDLGQILLELPGVSPEKMVKLFLEAVDVNLTLSDFFDENDLVSIRARNARDGVSPTTNGGGADNASRAPGPASTEPVITA